LNAQNDALLEILPDIKRAARQIELEWPDVATADDVEQDIVVRLLEDGYVVDARDLEPASRRRFLYKVAQQIASGERVDYEFFTGNFRYSAAEVRGHLENDALIDIEYEDLGDESETFSVEQVDIRNAFRSLSKDHQAVLFERFVYGNYQGVSWQPITRAIDALTRELNRTYKRAHSKHEGPGSRKAISNSQAQYISSQQNNSDGFKGFSRTNFE